MSALGVYSCILIHDRAVFQTHNSAPPWIWCDVPIACVTCGHRVCGCLSAQDSAATLPGRSPAAPSRLRGVRSAGLSASSRGVSIWTEQYPGPRPRRAGGPHSPGHSQGCHVEPRTRLCGSGLAEWLWSGLPPAMTHLTCRSQAGNPWAQGGTPALHPVSL